MIKGQIQEKRTNDYGYSSIKVAGTWFGADKKGAVNFNEGDTVEFEPFDKPGQNGKVWPSFKYQSLKAASGNAPASKAGSSYTPPKNAKDDYWVAKDAKDAEKEPRIAYFAALERAIQFTDVAVRTGALGALEKAKDTKKLDVLLAFVAETTDRFVVGSYAAAAPKAVKAAVVADEEPEAEEEESEGGKWS